MKYDTDQLAILCVSVLAMLVASGVVGAGYAWLPAELFGLQRAMSDGERIAFALRTDLFLFMWLAWCVREVSKGRFHSPDDRRGSAFGPPSPAIAIQAAVLQNSLEQTVLAFGAHLLLATVLRGPELVLIPLLMIVYLMGRVAFVVGYSRGAPYRGFGMALTAAPSAASYVLAAGLMLAGR